MVTLTQLKKVNCLEDLNALNIGRVTYDVGGRGGYCGFYSDSIAEHFNIGDDELPNNFGCYVNYLGGGIRGSITPSSFYKVKSATKRKLLAALSAACVRVYEDIEGDMNDEEDEDGETNWEAAATNAARAAGIISTY